MQGTKTWKRFLAPWLLGAVITLVWGGSTLGQANTPPAANPVTFSTNEDTPGTVTLSGSDAETCELAFSVVSGPSNGTLGPIGPVLCTAGTPNTDTASVTYTPSANYTGADSFTYQVCDDHVPAECATATVSITVNAINDAPTADNKTVTTAEDTPTAITLSGSDVETCDLTFSILSGPTNGSLGVIGGSPCTAGAPNSDTATVTYTPAANFNGPDSFTYVVNDGVAASAPATVSITVTSASDLSVTKTDGVVSVTAGDGITRTYTITVTNGGPSDATLVSLSDTWPAGFTRGTPTPSQGSCSNVGLGPDFTCSLGTIASGASATVTATYTVPPSTTGPQTNSASASSAVSDPTPGNNSASDTNTVLVSADLSLTKSDGAASVTAGDGITRTYTISVTNTGPADATSVSLSDTWPAGFTRGTVTPSQGSCDTTNPADFTCALGTITAGSSATVTASYTVPSSTTGSQTNTASASSAVSDPSPGNNSASDTNAVGTGADLSVTKTDGVVSVTAGDGITRTYTITVTNGGPSDATLVSLSDTWPAGFTRGTVTPSQGSCDTTNPADFTCALGTIASGASATVTASYTVPPSTTGPQTNTASASSAVSDPTPGNNSASDANSVNELSDLTILKTDSIDPVTAGTQVTYTITVGNTGPSNADNTTVTDTLPAGFSIATVSSSQGGCTALPCNLGTIVPGASATVTVVADVSPAAVAGVYTNTASADADESLSVSDSEDTTVTELSSLTIAKTDSPDPVIVGEQVTYTIAVGNTGPSNADNTTVTDTLPAGFSIATVSSSQGGCTALPCNLGTIVPGASATVTVVADVSPAAVAGVYTNTASADADESLSVSDSEDTTVTELSSLTIAKTDSPDPVIAGEQVTYTITVGNTGPSNADNTTVTDTLPAGFSVATVSSSEGGCTALPCNLGTIVPGASATVTVVSEVDPALDPGSYTNSAGAEAAESSPVSDDEVTSVITRADLSILKADSPDPVLAGGLLAYTVTVTNLGSSDAHDVEMTDTLPSETTFDSMSAGCTQSGSVVTCATPLLPAGDSVAWTITVLVDRVGPTVRDGTVLDNEAEVTTTTTDPASANNQVTESTTVSAPQLTLTKSAVPPSGSDVSPGEDVTFTITYANLGSAAATNFVVTDTVAALLGDVTPDAGGVFDLDTRVITWNVGSVGPSVTGSVSFTARVGASSRSQTIANRAFAISDELIDPISSNQTTHRLQPPDVLVIKSADRAENSEIKAFDLITYRIEIQNRGSGNALGVVVTDDPPPHMDYVSGSTARDGGAIADSGGTSVLFGSGLSLGTLTPGQTTLITFQMRVAASAPAGALIENWAYADWNLGTRRTGDFSDLRILRPRVGPTLRQSILVQAPSGRTIFVTVVNELLELLPVTGVHSVMLALLALSALGFGRAATIRTGSDLLRRRTFE